MRFNWDENIWLCQLIDEEQRQKSLEFVMNSGNVYCMPVGFENNQQMDDAIERIMKIVKA